MPASKNIFQNIHRRKFMPSRNVPSPEINIENFSTAIDFLGSLDNVNRDEIGVLSVFSWGGFILNATERYLTLA